MTNNIRRLRTKLGWSQERLSDESGVDRSLLSLYERDLGNPERDTLEKIAKALRVSVGDLFPSSAPKQQPIHSPIVASIRAGHGPVSFVYDEYEVNPPGEDVEGLWFKVKGNSMDPRYLDGELVFVHRDVPPLNGEFAVIVWNEHEDAAIRQVFYRDGKVILKSINQSYDPLLIDRSEISFIAAIKYSKYTTRK